MRRLSSLLALAGAMAGIIGAVAPWIPHRAAGLNVGGFDLFEMSKFLPAVRSGAVPLLREAFLLPLLVSATLLALAAAPPSLPLRPARWLGPAVAVAVALSAVPPYPAILSAHRNPEYRGQLLLAAATLAAALMSPLARRLPARVVAIGSAGLAITGLLLPLLQFAQARPLFAALYDAPVGIGWGLVTYALGLGAVLVSQIFQATLRQPEEC
jgi:hypothetical protein